MTVCELCELFIEYGQDVRIYDLNSNEIVYEGTAYEFIHCDDYGYTEIAYSEISSIDNIYKGSFDGFFTINIDLSEED